MIADVLAPGDGLTRASWCKGAAKRRDNWYLGPRDAKPALALFFDFAGVPSVLANIDVPVRIQARSDTRG